MNANKSNLFWLVAAVLVAFLLGLWSGGLLERSSSHDSAIAAEVHETVVKTVFVDGGVEQVLVPYMVDSLCLVPTQELSIRIPKIRVPVVATTTEVPASVPIIGTPVPPVPTVEPPAPPVEPPVVEPPVVEHKSPCNRGYGNGSEGCDPGNSGGQGRNNKPYPPEKEETNPKSPKKGGK